MIKSTADICDEHGDQIQCVTVPFRQFGARPMFSGPIRTVRVLNDNALVKSVLSTPGRGGVLVIDGGGSLKSALVGDQIAGIAHNNGWNGLLIFGAIRDSSSLKQIDLGIKAIGTCPRRSSKTGAGELDVHINFGESEFHPGRWLYSDDDGVVVSRLALTN